MKTIKLKNMKTINIESYLINVPNLIKKWWNTQGEQQFCDWVIEKQTYTNRKLKIKKGLVEV